MKPPKAKKTETLVSSDSGTHPRRPPTHAEDPILTVSEAAAQLGKTTRTVYNWIQSGVLEAGRHPESKRILGIRQSQIDQCLSLFPIGKRNDG